jgi:hypothetical protein
MDFSTSLKTNPRLRLLLYALVLLLAASSARAQTTTFTYQGKLTDGGTPANGSYDLQFKLWDAASGGTQQPQPSPVTVTLASVSVSAGIFTVQLDFGVSALPGANRFLEISARPNGGGSFTLLSPRQQISPTPYAIRTLGAGAADALSSACVGCVQDSQINQLAGSKVNGLIPTASVPAGSGNYIQNTTSPQASANFNISGDGTSGGTLTGNIINAASQYNIGGFSFASAPSNNTFVGFNAGQHTTGEGNAFFGSGAGQNNTAGFMNAFFGNGAGLLNTMGSGNSFFGQGAGFTNTMGINNSFFGASAGALNTGGSNSFFEEAAGQNSSTGSQNSFFGAGAGSANTAGASNTFIGASANGPSGVTNATAIGANARADSSNSLVLGSINGLNGAVANTSVGIGTSVPGYPLNVVGSAGSGSLQGVVEFSNSSPDTGIRINNTASGGHTWTLFSSGGSSGLGAGTFNIYDVSSGQARLSIDSAGRKIFAGGQVTVNDGNVFIASPNSLVITSPNGACWQIRVDNNGVLFAASVTCP